MCGETIASFGMMHPSLIVMVGEGRPTKTCVAGRDKGVDGGRAPTMTRLTDAASIEAFISPHTLS